ncbi:MAG: M23 family metallopeptidase [Lachnospiraceae bacterium]|nr:M23 family metallopeptidase [Lachnospiraceae bacterium]MDD6626706.1 M23 family metallopeptidase [Lachnospiraceae bacterium]
MARRDRNSIRKERLIMLASSVFVLTALTVTGVYVNKNNKEEQEDYVVDFEALEGQNTQTAENMMSGEELDTLFAEVGTDDLDYDPSFQEANSQKVENTEEEKKKDKSAEDEKSEEKNQDVSEQSDQNDKKSDEKDKKKAEEEAGMFDETVDTAEKNTTTEEAEAISTTVQPALDFSEEDGLVWPIVGDVLINYSMDKTIYFPTLEQYKYNPAIVISATQGENIAAAADGRVTSVGYDPVIGNTVVMDLGNGYELTYGQLDNIIVSEGSYVSVGDTIGTVASPTKYYSLEGTNVYFMLTKDDQPVNPMSKLQ